MDLGNPKHHDNMKKYFLQVFLMETMGLSGHKAGSRNEPCVNLKRWPAIEVLQNGIDGWQTCL
jgi:hypothetical protein